MKRKLMLLCVGSLLLATACTPEVGSPQWCEDMKEKPKGDWSANEAKDFASNCIFGNKDDQAGQLLLGERTGFYVFKDVFPAKVLNNLERVLRLFHHKWCEANQAFYQQKAINSAYLTDSKWLANTQRAQLFQFISSPHLLKIVEHYIAKPAFLNTQLFFSPYNNAQKNYWHRDIQYGYSDEQQKALLHEVDLMPHFRIPLADEQGLELIPGSHRRWDTPEEYDVRMTRNSRQSHFDLPGGEAISLQRGDVLMFSAKLLHRGLYQPDRFAFDVLFAPSDSHYLQSVETCCLPGENMPDSIATANVFLRTKCALQVPKE